MSARRKRDDGFCATPQARALLEGVLESASAYAATAQGRAAIQALAPQPTPEAASRHAAWVLEQKAMVAGLDRDAVRRLLRAVRSPAEPSPRFDTTRILIATDGDEQDHLVRLGANRWAQLGGPADLERAGDAELVLLCGDAAERFEDLDNALAIGERPSLDAVCPEAALAWFESNRPVLESCQGLAVLFAKASPSAQALALLATRPAKPADAASARKLLEGLLKESQAKLQKRVAAISISGQELLDSLGRKLPPSVKLALDETLAEARASALALTGLAIQPFTATLPLTLDEDELDRVEREGATRRAREHHQALAKLAKRLAALRPAVEAEAAAWQAFDAPFALGCFALACDLRPFRWGELAFTRSVHLDLATRPDAQRIAYHLGGTETVALLTGANSGGKTTLLEQVGQITILARLGLPVMGEDVEVAWVEEIHLLTARRTLDAGAFESFLRTFLPLAQGGTRRLVLADEVEAVTELEAAGRILGFFLDRVARTDSLAIVVTHMAPHILRHTTAPIRVDGIEASGLDGENRLVVDRMPRIGHLARSTPEFIVQRLASSSKGGDRALFEALLATFREPDPAALAAPPRLRRGAASATA